MTTSTSGAAAPGTAIPSAPRSGALLGTQLLFNVGFFAVVPFLAGILREDFALAGASVGLVLGLRTAAQQGLFLFGGALADRFGARFLILLGCAVRVAGFSLLAWSTADVRMPWRSDPAPGSVIAMAEISSPLTRPGSQRCFCSAVPSWLM